MPKLEWYKDAVPLSKLNNPRYKVISSMGLQIRRLQPNDAGIFQCFARNAAGELQVHTYLDVTSESEAKRRENLYSGFAKCWESALCLAVITGSRRQRKRNKRHYA